MPYSLKFGLFEKMEKVNDLKALMKKDLKSAVGKTVKFVAAKNYKVGGQALNLLSICLPA